MKTCDSIHNATMSSAVSLLAHHQQQKEAKKFKIGLSMCFNNSAPHEESSGMVVFVPTSNSSAILWSEIGSKEHARL